MVLLYFLTAILFWVSWFLLNGLLNMRSWKIRNRNRRDLWNKALVGKPEGKRPLGRPRHRWVDNIRMDLQEVGCGHVDWIGLAQDRDGWRKLVNAIMNLRVP